jgi:hypothetical protein
LNVNTAKILGENAMQDTFFYHSFPSRFIKEYDEAIEKGYKTLESIVDIGLLLTPEEVNWESHLGPIGAVRLRIRQKRISFTFLEEKDIRDHMIKWGPFSLVFSFDSIRALGAMPLFYVPCVRNSSSDSALPPQVMIGRLWRAWQILGLLDSNCLAGIRGLFGLLYPTEYGKEKEEKLGNYKLREWRITGNSLEVLFAQKLIERYELELEEKQRLRDLDQKFFCEDNLQETLKIRNFRKKHILTYADKILVPKIAFNRTESILSKVRTSGLPNVESY